MHSLASRPERWTKLSSSTRAAARWACASSALALLLGSCTLTRPSRDDCTQTAECRAAFGFGTTCGASGLCERVVAHPRCTRSFPVGLLEGTSGSGDAFVIGTIFDGTVETHQARERAIQLAFSEVRDLDGIEGREVGIVFCTNEVNPGLDDLDQAAASAEVARFLGEELGISVILGPPSSDSVRATFEATTSTGTLLVSPSATSASLTELEGPASDESPGRLWRTAAPDAFQARVIADDLTMRGVTTVAVIAQDGAYGNGLADELELAFGGTVTRHSFANASARNTAATDAGASDAGEVLFFSSQTSDVSAFVLFAESFAGYDTKQVFLSDSAANMDFLTDAASASAIFDRIRGTRPAAPEGIVFDAFVSAYAAENGGADVTLFSFTAQSYDAAWITLLGATWAQVQEGGDLGARNVARGLRMLSAGTPFDVRASSYTGIADRFRLDESVNVRGASGELDYDPITEETTAPIEVWRISAAGDAFDRVRVVTP